MPVKLVLKRLAQGAVTVWLVVTAVFIIMRLSGDPVLLFLPPEATQEDIETYRHLYGFDRPIYIQYFQYLLRASRGDLGESLVYDGAPALEVVLERMPATIELALVSILISIVIAIPAGIICASKPNSLVSHLLMLLALLGQAMPGFWLAILMILLFSVKLGMLPTGGRGGLQNLIMPSVVLGSWAAARTTRLVRAGMLEVLRQNYIRTARSKGLKTRTVLYRHALKNTLLPVLSTLGLTFGGLLGGAVITETVFAWPGVGRLIVQSILKRDFPVVQIGTIMMATVFTICNLLVDILYTVVDPRIRYGSS
jgi:peptide/nickel transport system permease protein